MGLSSSHEPRHPPAGRSRCPPPPGGRCLSRGPCPRARPAHASRARRVCGGGGREETRTPDTLGVSARRAVPTGPDDAAGSRFRAQDGSLGQPVIPSCPARIAGSVAKMLPARAPSAPAHAHSDGHALAGTAALHRRGHLCNCFRSVRPVQAGLPLPRGNGRGPSRCHLVPLWPKVGCRPVMSAAPARDRPRSMGLDGGATVSPPSRMDPSAVHRADRWCHSGTTGRSATVIARLCLRRGLSLPRQLGRAPSAKPVPLCHRFWAGDPSPSAPARAPAPRAGWRRRWRRPRTG